MSNRAASAVLGGCRDSMDDSAMEKDEDVKVAKAVVGERANRRREGHRGLKRATDEKERRRSLSRSLGR